MFGPGYTDTAGEVCSVASVMAGATAGHPTLFLLSPGFDPTDALLALAKRNRVQVP